MDERIDILTTLYIAEQTFEFGRLRAKYPNLER